MKKKKTYRFDAVVELREGELKSWFVRFPHSVEEEFGTRSSVRIKGTMNGLPIDRALIPMGDGSHYILLNTEMRRKMGLRAGSPVAVIIAENDKPEELDLPEELAACFEMEPEAQRLFEGHIPSVRRNVVYWIASAKTPETRAKRAAEMLHRIMTGTLRR